MALEGPPVPGTSYRVKDSAAIGEGYGALPSGLVVEVSDVVPGTVPGVGGTEEILVRLVWSEPGTVIGNNGKPAKGRNPRATTLDLDSFRKYFEVT